jgi:hypothetical protein
MKKNFILTSLIYLGFICFTLAQQVPNNDFENWSGGKPVSWDASNETVGFSQIITVNQVTGNVPSGQSAVVMETVTNSVPFIGQVTLPGIITLGDFILDIFSQTADIVGGIPFPHKPLNLKGQFKSDPKNNDKGLIGLGFSKWNDTENRRDTIGLGLLYFEQTVSVWTEFEVSIEWFNDETPDSLNIIVSSSDILSGTFQTGSKLWLDNLVFEYDVTSVHEIRKSIAQNYPNPFNKRTTISIYSLHNDNVVFSVFNSSGMLIHSENIQCIAGQNTINFDATLLSNGIYFYSVIGNNHNLHGVMYKNEE